MSAMFEKEMRHAVEFIPNRLYYVALSQTPPATSGRHYFSIDNEMIYWNFYLDFGPLNLGHVYRYCQLLNKKLNDPKLQDKVIYHYSHTMAQKRANAAFLICAWALLAQGRSPEDAFKPFKGYVAPFPPWHDATPTTCTFNLTILDTLRGLHKAREHKFFDYDNFNIEEYEHYEQVENGDLNWYADGKFLAFAGPHAEREMGPGGYHTHRPEDYVPYFKRKNVTLVVRLNKPYYDAKKFTNHGIDHMDLYFLDGSNPPDHILAKFIARCEETPGAVAVHCKAGLGRTGTCIACYIMKHYRWTAEEIIGWMRIARPGSVIGPQQHYLKDMQNRMWREGDMHRARLQQPALLPNVGGLPNKEETNDIRSSRPASSTGSPQSSRSPVKPTSPVMTTTTINSSTVTSTSKTTVTVMTSVPKQPSSPTTTRGASSSSPMSSGYLRPSSRGSSRPGSSSNGNGNGNEEENGNETQGDYLRMRRQQHLQQTGMYSLNTTTTTTTTTTMSSPSGGSGKMNTPLSSPSASDTPTRPRSRLSGFLSSWKS